MSNKEFGIGFELEFHSCSLQKANSAICEDYGFIKEECDTSSGFELESRVFDRNDFINLNQDQFSYWADLFKQIKSTGCYQDSLLGHHIHIDFDAIDPLKSFRLNQLFFNNYTFLCVFAERDIKYNQFWEIASFDGFIKGTSSRRFFVNSSSIQDGTRTIEYRFFSSTNEVSTFLKNTQFLIAWYDFAEICENFETLDFKSTILAYLEFVKQNKSVYSELFKFISENFKELADVIE